MKPSSRSVEQSIAAIQSLDFGLVKRKLMDPEEGQGWSREHAERIELAYRRYLTLLAKYPDVQIAPTRDLDRFWHGHILDTLKYAEDCQNIFGRFVHHFPYAGMRGEDDAANLRAASENMRRLYEREFGEPLPGRTALCWQAAPSAKPDTALCWQAQPAG
jgi:hypothetical protein